ncbi:MAG: thermonuclease family protein [Candidatus Omnitrophota bacterium]|nr:thermonuclease family protein [Candidatus Omnitrophota bacterium]
MKRLFLILIMTVFTSPAWAESQFVQSVIDGRTLKLINGDQIRLIGIDLNDDQSKETGDFVRSLVSGSVVEVEYDVNRIDEEGNLLAYIWFEYEGTEDIAVTKFPEEYDMYYFYDLDQKGKGSFHVLLNSTMIKSGYAIPANIPPNTKHAQLFEDLYRANQDQMANVPSGSVQTASR